VLVQKLVPGMIERGGGSVINVTTVAASTPAAGAGIYGASKAALELLTKLWADEFGTQGVRVNAVAPGPTQTQGTAAFESDLIEGLGRTTALGRTAEADEIANVVTFVASPAASYVNGAILTVGGGAQAIKPAA
jgi:NAD(P)-dependent dehydrogenase (short-subunit alcohol dehydrogenase family)